MKEDLKEDLTVCVVSVLVFLDVCLVLTLAGDRALWLRPVVGFCIGLAGQLGSSRFAGRAR